MFKIWSIIYNWDKNTFAWCCLTDTAYNMYFLNLLTSCWPNNPVFVQYGYHYTSLLELIYVLFITGPRSREGHLWKLILVPFLKSLNILSKKGFNPIWTALALLANNWFGQSIWYDNFCQTKIIISYRLTKSVIG